MSCSIGSAISSSSYCRLRDSRPAAAVPNDAPNGALAAFLARDRQALVVPDSLQLRFPVLSIIGSEEGISQDELALMIHQLETHVVSGVDHFGLPGNIDVITKTIDFLDL